MNYWEMTTEERTIDSAKNLISLGFGDVPLNRQLGISRNFIHKPINIAKSMFVAEVYRNLETYAPNVLIRNISLTNDLNEKGEVKYNLDLEIRR